MSRRASTSYESIADRYEESRGGQRRADAIAAAIHTHLPARARVLDVGVGTGIIAATLERRGHDVVGFDISPGMLRQAAPRLPGRVALGDALALPVADATVDAVVFVWVLHHAADATQALAEARRVMRPEGCVLALAAWPASDDSDMTDVTRPIRALHRERMDEVRDLAPIVPRVGLRVAAVHEVVMPFDESPADLARHLEHRLFAPLFAMDDRTFARDVQPVIDALRALPDPERPRRREDRHPLSVLRPTV